MDYTYEELLKSCREELISVQNYCRTMTIKCSDPDALGDYFKGFNTALEYVYNQIEETLKYL